MGTFLRSSAPDEDKIIFSSTAAVYGNPMTDVIDEKHPISPNNYYGQTKLHLEETLKWFSNLKGIKYASLRYFNAAGADPNCEIGEFHKPETHLIPLSFSAASNFSLDSSSSDEISSVSCDSSANLNS